MRAEILSGRFLDVGRNVYLGLPSRVRRYLGTALRAIPTDLRLGSTYRAYRELIEKARNDPDFVEREQRACLLHVLKVALEKSAYYRKELTSTFGEGVGAEDLIDPEQWMRVPILTRETVRREAARLCTRPPWQLDHVTTGGSSGQTLAFFTDRHRSPIEYAYAMDQWARAGCGPDDWRVWFRGFHIPDVDRQPFEVEYGLREFRISVFHMRSDLMERYAVELDRRGICFLQGYPSAIATFAAFLIRRDHSVRHKIRGVLLHSEPTYPEFRRVIGSGFPNAKLIPFYGLTEKCAFGAEVEGEPDTYEMDPLYGYTEVVDDAGRPVTEPGRDGRLISTGLQFTGMPFIRYDTGDRATLVEPPDRSNGYRLRVKNVASPRGRDFFISRSRHLVPSISMNMGEEEFKFIVEYQFEQRAPGELLMRVVLTEDAPPHALDAYLQLVTERAAGELSITPVIVKEIPLTVRGKRKFVIQHLDIATAVDAAGLGEGALQEP